MKFCQNCGKELADEARFCSSCGQVAEGAAYGGTNVTGPEGAAYGGANTGADEAPLYTGPEPFAGYSPAGQVNINASANQTDVNASANAIKKVGGSPVFLVCIICMILDLIVGLIPGTGLTANLVGSTTLSMLIIDIPTILVIIGMLMFYAGCKGLTPSGKGIGVYKAAKVVVIVYLGIFAALVLLIMILGGVVLDLGIVDDYIDTYTIGNLSGITTGVLVILMLILLVVIALGILLEAKLIEGANIVRECLSGTWNGRQFPIYPFVIYIIITVGSVISLIYSLVQSFQIMRYVSYLGYSGYSNTLIITIITSLLGAAQLILSAVLLKKMHSAINWPNIG